MSRNQAAGTTNDEVEAETLDNRPTSRLSPAVLALTALLGSGQSVLAVQSGADQTGRKELLATQVDDGPEVDGRLDEPVWARARFVSDFTQLDPNEGEPATQRTEVAILYDGANLYVGARLYREDPSRIQAFMTRRDELGSSSQLSIILDSFLDRRTSHTFVVTAAGVRADYFQPEDEDNFRSRDFTFDPIWEADARLDSIGWSAEMRIPLSQLRFNESSEQVWGIQINRWMPDLEEDVFWVHIPKTESGWASRFGNLVGLGDMESHRPIEVLPFAATNSTLREGLDPRNPFLDNPEISGRVGADLKAGIGPNLTLDATVNPDFGQVEPDPAVVNLSAFEVFFDERRPFFTEGSQLLEGQGPRYYRSRRIGARPHARPDGDFVDVPDATTILGASKLTGRLPSGLSVGGLAAVTANEYGKTYDVNSDRTREMRVEPLTGYGVLRLQQELDDYGSTTGLSLTGVRRDLSSTDALAVELSRAAYAGGADWTLRFDEGAYELSGHAGFSHIRGEEAAILEAQESSARYYQRPDADYVELDPTRRSLTGYTGEIEFQKRSGEHWLWEIGGSAMSPGFEINDLGRLREADELAIDGELEYRETDPGSFYRDYSIELGFRNQWNFGGVRTNSFVRLDTRIEWPNFMRSSVGFRFNPRGLSDSRTRGGPLMGTGARWGADFETSSSFSNRTRWDVEAGYSEDELGGWGYEVSGRFSTRPTDRWELSIRPEYDRRVDPRQYVTTLGGGRPITFGQRYIFGAIERSTLSAQIRMNYSFTPDMSLELFAEPFASNGDFFDLGELAAPGSRELRVYGQAQGTTARETEDGGLAVTADGDSFVLENEDFTRLSFRSTIVLRWEWRLGSTLFLVWQQDRSDFRDRGDLVAPGDLWDTFGAEGDNVLTLKVSYWLPI